jgi:hypothetical protein
MGELEVEHCRRLYWIIGKSNQKNKSLGRRWIGGSFIAGKVKNSQV